MNGHLWRELFLTAHNPVFYDGQPYVDLSLFSTEKYPALKILKKQCSTLEILVLAQLILQSEWDDPEDQYCSETMLIDLFKNYDCTDADVIEAICNLIAIGWVEQFVELGDDSIHYKAIIPKLIEDGTYIINEWDKLYRLSLYGKKISKN